MKLFTAAVMMFGVLAVSASPAHADSAGFGTLTCRYVSSHSADGWGWHMATQWALGYVSGVSELEDSLDVKGEVAGQVRTFNRRFKKTDPKLFISQTENFIKSYCRARPKLTVKDATERYMLSDMRNAKFTPKQ